MSAEKTYSLQSLSHLNTGKSDGRTNDFKMEVSPVSFSVRCATVSCGRRTLAIVYSRLHRLDGEKVTLVVIISLSRKVPLLHWLVSGQLSRHTIEHDPPSVNEQESHGQSNVCCAFFFTFRCAFALLFLRYFYVSFLVRRVTHIHYNFFLFSAKASFF